LRKLNHFSQALRMKMNKNKKPDFRLLIIENEGVGKSSLLERICDDTFSSDNRTTVVTEYN